MSVLNNPNAFDSAGIITEKVLTVQAAARWSGYNPQYIRRLLRQGKLEGIRAGQTWLVRMDSLSPYLQQADETSDQRYGAKKTLEPETYTPVNGVCLQAYTATPMEE